MFAYFKRNILFLAGNSGPDWFKKLERQQDEPSREQQDLECQKLIFPTRVFEPWKELSGEVVESSLLEMLPTWLGSVILDLRLGPRVAKGVAQLLSRGFPSKLWCDSFT